MTATHAAVLVDTMVILEAHAKKCWAALAGGHKLETVEMCITETQTGNQQRDPEQNIDEKALRASLRSVHPVDHEALAEVLLLGGASLHAGERHLWAHALTRNDAWVLCGPDIASLRFGYNAQMRNRIITLEELLADVGFRAQKALQSNYSKKFNDQLMSNFVLGLL